MKRGEECPYCYRLYPCGCVASGYMFAVWIGVGILALIIGWVVL